MGSVSVTQFTEDQQVQALLALVKHDGNVTAAAKAAHLDRDEVDRWVQSGAFAEARRSFQAHLEKELVAEALEQSIRLTRIGKEAATRLEGLMKHPAVKAQEMAAVLDKVESAKAKNLDKMLALQGRPGQIIERHDFQTTVKALIAERALVPLEGRVLEEGKPGDTG